jgi:transcriptional regulator with XRE-family HTH domain
MMLAACTFTAGLPQRTMRAMNMREKRLINLKRLAAQYHKGKLAAVAERAGTDPNYLYQITGGSRSMGDDLARRIEEAYNLVAGTFDRLKEEEVLAELSQDTIQIAEIVEQLSPNERAGLLALLTASPIKRVGGPK